MKKFKFRLQRVLEYRESLKKEKERELALRNAELHAAEQRLEDIITAQDKTEVPANRQMTMAELMLSGDYLRFLQEMLVNQRLLVIQATDAVEEAREAYIEKAIEAESLEMLKDKKFEEYKTERKRDERKELDKLTVQRYRFTASGGIAKGEGNGNGNG